MGYGQFTERMMGMSDGTWLRHANPWSGWTRVIIAPLLTLAIWSRVWLGWWCLLPISLIVAWIWINPRAFPAPASTNNWMSKAVMGERLWLNRKEVPIPQRHARMADILSMIALVGIIPYIWGMTVLDPWMTVAGLIVVMGAKLWFLDRMVWLFDDMSEQNDEYKSWLT